MGVDRVDAVTEWRSRPVQQMRLAFAWIRDPSNQSGSGGATRRGKCHGNHRRHAPSEIERAGQLAELPRRSGSAPSPTKPEAEDLRCHWAAKVPEDSSSSLHSSSGMMRRMNSSNIGTVKAVSPWPGLQIMPLPISLLRVGAKDCT